MTSNVRIRILAFGASLTEGYYSYGLQFHPYTIRLGQCLRSIFSTVDINNAGVSGEAVLSETMLPRLKNLLSSAENNRYNLVLILAGTNDILRDQQEASRVFKGYHLLIDECIKHGAQVLSMTLPETGYGQGPDELQRQEFNRLIREELASKNNIGVLDVDKLLPYHSLSPNERKQIWDDEVHLKPFGYDQLGQLIYEKLQKHFVNR
jgi:lysophospholipase L1-like esterase